LGPASYSSVSDKALKALLSLLAMISCKRAKSKNLLIIHRISRYGANHTISYKEHPDYSTIVKDITKGKGVDMIFDPILASNFDYVRDC
jgi:NADPH:quinone reductase-like Zn-dependent oxidoreductase